MPRKYIPWLLMAAAPLFLFSACKPRTEEPETASGDAPPSTEPAEGFALIDASAFNTDDYKGQVLLLDFWATWCGPCKMEIPHLIELQKKYGDRGLTIVGITLDENPDKDVPPYAAEVGMNYLNVRGTDELKSEYGIVGLPTIVIYDRDGREVMKRPGYIEAAQLEGIIKPLLTPPA